MSPSPDPAEAVVGTLFRRSRQAWQDANLTDFNIPQLSVWPRFCEPVPIFSIPSQIHED